METDVTIFRSLLGLDMQSFGTVGGEGFRASLAEPQLESEMPCVGERFIRRPVCPMRAHTRVCRTSPTCSSSSSESQRHCLPRVSSQPCYRPRLKCLCAAQLDSTPLLTALHDRGKSLQASFHVPGHKVRASSLSRAAEVGTKETIALREITALRSVGVKRQRAPSIS